MTDRVEIFVDGSNFYHGLKKQFGDGRCDFEKLVARVLPSRQLVRFNDYAGTVHPGHQARVCAVQQAFLARLRLLSFPVKIHTRPMQYLSRKPLSPPREKGIDTRIVQDLIVGALDKRFDAAVLLSGDRYFVDVVRLISSRFGVKVETYYPASRRHLFEACREAFAKAETITRRFYDSIR
jgi:uncharacterized LabA/DUF88 family protein